MSQYLFYSLQFILGGASVVAITMIAKYIHPKYTGIAYALPVILLVSVIFIYLGQGLEASRSTLNQLSFMSSL